MAEDEVWGAALTATAPASNADDSPSPSEEDAHAEDAEDAGAEDYTDRSRHTPSEFAAAAAVPVPAIVAPPKASIRPAASSPPKASIRPAASVPPVASIRPAPPPRAPAAWSVTAPLPVTPAAPAPAPAPAPASPAPAPADAAPSAPAPVPAAKPIKPRRTRALLAALFVVNAVVVAGLFGLRYEERRARLPVAAISADVRGLREEQAGARVQLDETRAKLDETRLRLDEQANVLANTMVTVAETAQRQKDADREAREREARERAEIAALSSRINRVEKSTYKLNEAIQLIDLVQGRVTPSPGSPPGSEERPIVNP